MMREREEEKEREREEEKEREREEEKEREREEEREEERDKNGAERERPYHAAVMMLYSATVPIKKKDPIIMVSKKKTPS